MSGLYGQLLSRICHGTPRLLKTIGFCPSVAHSPRFLNCHPHSYTNLSVLCSFPFPIYCIYFLLLLGQGTIKWVDESNTYFLPYNPRNQKFKVGFVELTSRCLQGCIPSIASGGEPVGLSACIRELFATQLGLSPLLQSSRHLFSDPHHYNGFNNLGVFPFESLGLITPVESPLP